MLFRGSENYEEIKVSFLKWAEKIKMMVCSAASLFKQATKTDKTPKEDKFVQLCKQVEDLQMIIMKQPRQSLKQAKSVCYKCGKKSH